jgi:hypothetical protein
MEEHMKKHTIGLAIILGVMLTIVATFAHPTIVLAQTCHDPFGNEIACPPVKVKKKKPTLVPRPPTKTATPPPTFTPTMPPIASLTPEVLQLLPPSSGGGGSQDQTSGFPGGFGGGLGMIIVVCLIIVVCIGGGIFFWQRLMGDGSRPPGPPTKPGVDAEAVDAFDGLDTPGSDRMGAQPHMNPGEQQPPDPILPAVQK